jgi:hypothetical protein
VPMCLVLLRTPIERQNGVTGQDVRKKFVLFDFRSVKLGEIKGGIGIQSYRILLI